MYFFLFDRRQNLCAKCRLTYCVCTSRGRRPSPTDHGAHAVDLQDAGGAAIITPPKILNEKKKNEKKKTKMAAPVSRRMLIHRPFFPGGGGVDAIKKPRVRVGARLETGWRNESATVFFFFFYFFF